MKMIKYLILILSISLLGQSNARGAIVVLPDPTETVDGLPVAQQFDEFISYSTQLLTQFGFEGFDGPAGVGGLDVVLLTQAGGIDNDPIARTGPGPDFLFEDPVPSVTGGTSTLSGTWGQDDRDNGPVLVDTILDYLRDRFDPEASTPVFTFDLVEPGSSAKDLDLVANFIVWNPDPDNPHEVASWSIDAINNGVFDPTAFITVEGSLSFTGLSDTVYTANNTGSGEYDYLLVAPTMNLALYEGLGYEFHIFSSLRNLNGGGEEAFISGAFRAPIGTPLVPEPSTFALIGLGLVAFGFRRFRSTKA